MGFKVVFNVEYCSWVCKKNTVKDSRYIYIYIQLSTTKMLHIWICFALFVTYLYWMHMAYLACVKSYFYVSGWQRYVKMSQKSLQLLCKMLLVCFSFGGTIVSHIKVLWHFVMKIGLWYTYQMQIWIYCLDSFSLGNTAVTGPNK